MSEQRTAKQGSARERVAVVKVVEQRLGEAVAHVVALLGSLDEIVPRGSRILVKPNFVFPPTDRGITHHPGLYYYPSHRVLARLGLAYPVDSATRPYYLLPEGLVEALARFERRTRGERAPAAVPVD